MVPLSRGMVSAERCAAEEYLAIFYQAVGSSIRPAKRRKWIETLVVDHLPIGSRGSIHCYRAAAELGPSKRDASFQPGKCYHNEAELCRVV
jgi:hypothetical protein